MVDLDVLVNGIGPKSFQQLYQRVDMVSGELSVVLTYIQVIALTLPVLAIVLQAMVIFSQNRYPGWESSTGRLHQWLLRERFSFLFYSFVVLYVILVVQVWIVYEEMNRPSVLAMPTYGFAIAFGLLLLGISGFMYNVGDYIKRGDR